LVGEAALIDVPPLGRPFLFFFFCDADGLADLAGVDADFVDVDFLDADFLDAEEESLSSRRRVLPFFFRLSGPRSFGRPRFFVKKPLTEGSFRAVPVQLIGVLGRGA
jgi:hypothetical protein